MDRISKECGIVKQRIIECFLPYQLKILDIFDLYIKGEFSLEEGEGYTYIDGVKDFSELSIYKDLDISLMIRDLKKDILPLVDKYYSIEVNSEVIKYFGKLNYIDQLPELPLPFLCNEILKIFFYSLDEKIFNRIVSGSLIELLTQLKKEEYPNITELSPIGSDINKEYYFDNLVEKIKAIIDVYKRYKVNLINIVKAYNNDEFVGSHEEETDIEIDVFNYLKSDGYVLYKLETISKTILSNIQKIVKSDFQKNIYKELQYVNELVDYNEISFKEVLYVNILDMVNPSYNEGQSTLSMDYALMTGDFIYVLEELIKLINDKFKLEE